jgi:hypothetical protein
MLNMNKLIAQITFLRKKLVTLLCKFYLGKDFTPLDVIPDEVGCAEAVTTLLKQAGTIPYVIAGTWTLNDYLQRSIYWQPTNTPQEGDIIISPTGTSKYGSKAPIIGHVGIVGPKNMVYANNSYTGKWSTIYTVDSWDDRYKVKGGYPTYYYTFVSAL